MREPGLKEGAVCRDLAHHADVAAPQPRHLRDAALRRRHQQRGVAVHDRDGLGLDRHRDVGAHDGEIGLIVLDRLGRGVDAFRQHQPQPHRRALAGHVLLQRDDEPRVLAAHRPDRDLEGRRRRGPLVHDEAAREHGEADGEGDEELAPHDGRKVDLAGVRRKGAGREDRWLGW